MPFGGGYECLGPTSSGMMCNACVSVYVFSSFLSGLWLACYEKNSALMQVWLEHCHSKLSWQALFSLHQFTFHLVLVERICTWTGTSCKWWHFLIGKWLEALAWLDKSGAIQGHEDELSKPKALRWVPLGCKALALGEDKESREMRSCYLE